MLQCLELIGFKSFADKTRFDFAPGITAVVGPNGSGKSNIVDAVKWVLGEQSAKSLRGGEMADVIFNGSSTRKSLGMAEVSMTFDNRGRQLGTDAAEVRITRRVYRDGQGEYLINGQAARLRDIKDLFLGSGAGHGAYSVIEQGRVDALLTASTADRRVLFEEAAGVSRFKARKLEASRKLERVDADLTRVRDILQELEKQLRTLRLQAAKAQRYQEYTGRLRALRVGLGLSEYRELTGTLNGEEAILAAARAESAALAEREQTGEEELGRLAALVSGLENEIRDHTAALGDARQKIAAGEAEVRAERGQMDRLEAELTRLGKQRVALAVRLAELTTHLVEADRDLAATERTAADEQTRADAAVAALNDVIARIDALAKSSQADRDRQFELARATTRLQSEAETLRREADRWRRELAAKRVEVDRTAQRHDALAIALEHLSKSDADVRQRLTEAKQNLAEHLAARDDLRGRADAIQPNLDQQREARSAVRGRIDILEGLQQSLEGIGAGVREVLRRSAAGDPTVRCVIGLVADFLAAPREVAPLIDLALGEAAQQFVVTDPAALDPMIAGLTDLPGRVGFFPLAPPALPNAPSQAEPDPAALRAADLVSVDNPALASLPQQLLADVFIVPDLPTARAFAGRRPRARFVTRSGEMLDSDGTLTVGPAVGGVGILSRKSELRELKDQLRQYDERIGEWEAQQAELRQRAEALEGRIRSLETEVAALGGEAGTLQTQIRDQKLEKDRLEELHRLSQAEAESLDADVTRIEADLQTRQQEWAAAEGEERQVSARLAQSETALAAAQADRDHRQTEHTAAQVSLGRVTAHLAAVRKTRDELGAELGMRRQEADALAAAERAARGRLTDCQLRVLRSGADAAEAYARKEAAERAVAVLAADRDRLRLDRDRVMGEVKAHREDRTRHRDRVHSHEMLVRDLVHRRDTLAARLKEDYGEDLAELAARQPAGTDDDPILLEPAPADPEAVQEEIDDLRRKVAKLGNVNLEALDELADVEKREADLRAQHDDLTESQQKLAEIISRINVDSRKLFVDTLNTVREHFQELFRKLFGGGMADVILEDESDPLESGIEVTARPPGKELRSISLLSGGERTLTAVALLLAIFRSRPSPFCLLDEVDAALDEANTARLGDALRGFLDKSQFIIVTHKKRTMAIADAIFGITMQESGVSKQVSVRFEDWPEEQEAEKRTAA